MQKCTYSIENKGTYLDFKVEGFYFFKDFINFPKIILKHSQVWPTKDITQFMEVVAANRSTYIRIVSSPHTALQWLMSETEGETETALLN